MEWHRQIAERKDKIKKEQKRQEAIELQKQKQSRMCKGTIKILQAKGTIDKKPAL